MTLLREPSTAKRASTPAPRVPGEPAVRSTFRSDVQGLRALAITAVVLNHVVGWPTGGFVGVDVFFVISGFLITGVLLREHARTGRISLRGFYMRRVRRIAPAAAVVLLVTVGIASIVTPGAAFRRVTLDAIASMLSVANWRFAATGTDYFAQTGATSPLQHFWSLAVEEQFYFIWPFLLMLLLAVARRRSLRRAVVTALIAGLLLSFLLAWWQSAGQPTVAYFSSATRAWELGLGATVALAAGHLERIPTGIAWVATRLGLILIVVSVFVVRPGEGFPGPFAALPVLGSVLVIAGGVPRATSYPSLLTNRVAVFLGAISYSWYLWHFPVWNFLEALAIPGKRRVVAALVLGLALAWLSYRFIEQPFLTARGSAQRGPAAPVRQSRLTQTSLRTFVAAAAAVAMAVSAVALAAPAVQAQAAGRVAPPTKDQLQPVQRAGTPASALEQNLITALQATTWPTLSPAAAEVEQTGSPTRYDSVCSATVIADPGSCSFGAQSSRTIVVFGDSLGITLLPTVVGAYGASYHVRGLTLAGCAVADVDVAFGDAAGRAKCLQMRADAIKEVTRTRPVLVLMIENSAWDTRLSSGATGDAAVTEWRAGVQRSVTALRQGAAAVAVVGPSIDTGTGIAECAGPLSTPASCITQPTEAWNVAHRAETGVTGATYLSTLHWYCVRSWCPAFSGRVPIKRDFVHPTAQYAQQLVADFRTMTSPLLRG